MKGEVLFAGVVAGAAVFRVYMRLDLFQERLWDRNAEYRLEFGREIPVRSAQIGTARVSILRFFRNMQRGSNFVCLILLRLVRKRFAFP